MTTIRRVLCGMTIWFLAAVCALPVAGSAADPLFQVRQDFTRDPGWEGVNNRIEATDPPTVTQDFGWSGGRIGGTVWRSTTPAWYGMPLDPPLTFKDRFTASGKIAVTPGGRGGVAYLGFFNHERQGWRPFSSMALRIRHVGQKAFIYTDYMTANWRAGAAEMELEIPTDGSQHAWSLLYDPHATRGEWTDLKLKSYLTKGRQTMDQLLAKAAVNEPEVSSESLRERLNAAVQAGLISYLPRHNTEYWLLKQVGEPLKGSVTVQIGDGPAYTTYLNADRQEQPVVLDRFGIFNMQMNHAAMEFYVSGLEVNGEQIDLGSDPGWQGRGNRTTFVERDFRPRMDFGYSPDTNFAGGERGEIGGQFYGRPHHAHYADDVGRLTLDDPIRFSGRISFHEGSTDAGMFFGYFNSADRSAVIADPRHSGWPQANSLGIRIDGVARIGWWLAAWGIPRDEELARRLSKTEEHGRIFLPTREHRTFEFVYDPEANGGVGRITVTLDDERFTVDLTPQQRRAGGVFDRFGLMSGKSAKYVTLYLDDLAYTARRSPDAEPVRRPQPIIRIPYPRDGLYSKSSPLSNPSAAP